ncbi:hypothetical protein OSB04_020965 [Centaurea solstitialis]|uniref:U1-type domain-containing protein n=1 Tax=Centaurea solstitialis TaxID=347529 RepID=A0AA38W4G3_9ASTR|nr:hypothetical protein OSB04_020965 [Centaurea solstitialis]
MDAGADAQAHQDPFYRKQPSSSTYSHFREQAIRVGSQSRNLSGGGNVGAGMFRGPLEMREAIQREREKDRIRAEIIAEEEMARRRILEAEVRNELRMEREMMAMRSGVSLPFMSLSMQPSHDNFEPRILHRRQPIGLEERIGMSLEEKYKHPHGGNRFAFRGFEAAPFQWLRDSPKIDERIPTPLSEDTKKEVILLDVDKQIMRLYSITRVDYTSNSSTNSHRVNFSGMIQTTEKMIPRCAFLSVNHCYVVLIIWYGDHVVNATITHEDGESLSGTKRKSAPSVGGELSKPHSNGSRKKLKEEWSCAICQVSATSERGLTEHLQGKKHQSKEAGLIAQKSGGNLGLGVSPKKPIVKPTKLALTTVTPSSSEKKSKSRKDSRKETSSSSEVKKEDGRKKSDKFKFWCEMCEVGAFSEKVMNHHKEGKKHLTKLVKLLQKGKVEESEASKVVVGDDVEDEKQDYDDGSSNVVVVVKEVKQDDDGSSNMVVVKEVKLDDNGSSNMVVVEEEEKSEVKEVMEDARDDDDVKKIRRIPSIHTSGHGEVLVSAYLLYAAKVADYMMQNSPDFLPFFLSDTAIGDTEVTIVDKRFEDYSSQQQLELGTLTHCLRKHILVFSGSFPDVEMRKDYECSD